MEPSYQEGANLTFREQRSHSTARGVNYNIPPFENDEGDEEVNRSEIL